MREERAERAGFPAQKGINKSFSLGVKQSRGVAMALLGVFIQGKLHIIACHLCVELSPHDAWSPLCVWRPGRTDQAHAPQAVQEPQEAREDRVPCVRRVAVRHLCAAAVSRVDPPA